MLIPRQSDVMEADRGSNDDHFRSYNTKWREILEGFGRTQCRCEEMSRGQRCENYGDSHAQGHQFNLSGAGRVKSGCFRSGFPAAIPGLQKAFSDRMLQLLTQNISHSGSAWRWRLLTEAQLCGAQGIISNRTCLTCLSRTPIHILPCQHTICDECALDFNCDKSGTETTLIIKECPLGCHWNVKDWLLRRKPPAAGVRILSLDGYVCTPRAALSFG